MKVLANNKLPGSVCSLVTGATDVGEAMAKDERLPLISFTGSCAAGQKVITFVDSRRRTGKPRYYFFMSWVTVDIIELDNLQCIIVVL